MFIKKYFDITNNSDNLEMRKDMSLINLSRARSLAYVTIILESILIISDVTANFLQIDARFKFDFYLFAYLIFILINIIFILFAEKLKQISTSDKFNIKTSENIIIVYMTLIMSWGSVMSLADQRLYGHLMVFMVNTITCSVIFITDNKKIAIPYLIAHPVIIIGLPFFQKSSDVLIGHYVNLSIFIVISFVSSRIIYLNYCREYRNKELLKKSHSMLEDIVKENKEINHKLEIANNQLKKLALVDELTGIANRRSFRNFIDLAYEALGKDNMNFSAIMIDIDFFKEYNDNYGHVEGDKVLIAVANEISSVVSNPLEFAARWGGEEFLYAAFNKSSKYVQNVAEEIKSKINNLKIPHKYSGADNFLSISVGVYTTDIHNISDVARIIEIADKMMYRAKESGRNRIIKKEEV